MMEMLEKLNEEIANVVVKVNELHTDFTELKSKVLTQQTQVQQNISQNMPPPPNPNNLPPHPPNLVKPISEKPKTSVNLRGQILNELQELFKKRNGKIQDEEEKENQ